MQKKCFIETFLLVGSDPARHQRVKEKCMITTSEDPKGNIITSVNYVAIQNSVQKKCISVFLELFSSGSESWFFQLLVLIVLYSVLLYSKN